jgi:hypothetical protein
MVDIIILDKKKDARDPSRPKNCPDFIPLKDGTIKGDWKYCDMSKECRQFDPVTGMGFCSEWHEWYEFYTDENGKLAKEKCMDYLCTGNFPVFQERSDDEEAN